ncbi:hypothetical protein [Neisseria weixii]
MHDYAFPLLLGVFAADDPGSGALKMQIAILISARACARFVSL